uniref:Secernin-2 n=1 Tax=Scylla olivacea TaxID=85551 RepID=A0A0P4VWG1_SCYOL
MSPRPPPQSCDTFVVLPDLTKGGHVVFGKNSDRPQHEVQEIIYRAAADHDAGSKVQCTYIEVDQVEHTHAVILSKPSWMWGAEMGANEHGVCVGNEAVQTKLLDDADQEERLLGMDMVRLALERSTSAANAVEVLAGLLESHGQGGACSEDEPDMYYHNSFIIADATEAWVLETAGQYWAAEHIKSGYRNISNALSIGTKIDRMSDGLPAVAQEKGFWDGSGDFDFSKAFGVSEDYAGGRKECGEKLLAKLTEGGDFSLTQMFEVLRDEESGISRGTDHKHPTAGSMVSVVSQGKGRPSCHWFTGTPDPCRSVFKPFIFTDNVKISPHIQSPHIPENQDPAKVVPRFASKVNRTHLLYRRQQQAMASGDSSIWGTLRQLEEKCVQETETVLESFDPERLSEMDDLLKDCIDSELKFYK